jgi:Domain of unknown function (DUF4429)/Short C-terminal domain
VDESIRGLNATWAFEDDAVRIRYSSGIRVPRLLRELGIVVVPNAAIADVVMLAGRRGTVALRLVLRPGSDPLLTAAAGQLPERDDPYRLLLPAARETIAEYYADELRGRIEAGERANRPTGRFLLQGPAPPRRMTAYDGGGFFDGEHVTLHWVFSASRRKLRAGPQRFHVSQLDGVEWAGSSWSDGNGFVRLRVAGWPREPVLPRDDLAALTFGFGRGDLATSLPFAAAILARIPGNSAAPAPGPDPSTAAMDDQAAAIGAIPGTGDPDEIVRRIRKLGELRDAGLVTDEEFATKKAELLRRL